MEGILMKNPILSILPLGGVGEIGSNMTLLETANESFIIDCGILFPNDDLFNIQYLIPNWEMLSNVSTLIITHGHEDHIGAIPHLIDHFPNINIWCSKFSGALIRRKLREKKKSGRLNFFDKDTLIKIDDLIIQPIPVNHSIPETFGLFIKNESRQLSLFYISDFKYDPESPYEDKFDLKALSLLGENSKKRILLADSTNILSKNRKTGSESEIIDDLEELIEKAKGRTFITLFASNIHRIQIILEICERQSKRIFLSGRSIKNYLEVAFELGIIPSKYQKLIKENNQEKLKENRQIILVSGCQGDFRSATRRISYGEDSNYSLGEQDTFIFSSKTIPGNETKIGAIFNKITETGCRLITTNEKKVHVSGHAGRDDLLQVYQSFEPTDIIPIHGESYFLKSHSDFIKASYPQANSILFYNFHKLSIYDDLTIKTKEVDKKVPIIIHGNGLPLEREAIKERRKIAQNGLVILSVLLSAQDLSGISFDYNLVGMPACAKTQLKKFEQLIDQFIEKEKKKSTEDIKESLRISVRRYFSNFLGYKPVVIINIL